jgi:glutathione S-transferase
MTVLLHCFGESGNAYKAALAMELTGIAWEPIFVDFFQGATRSTEFRRINPLGEVPVAETPDGVMSQSGIILDWVAETSGRMGWTTPQERREILRWVLFDNHKVSGVAGPLRFNMNFLPPEKRQEPVNAFLAMRLGSALKVMETRLAERQWLALDGPTIADISCCGYLYYDESFGFARPEYPAIDAWLDRISMLPGWKHPYELMPRGLPEG